MTQTPMLSKEEKALRLVSEPLRSMAARLAHTQAAIQADYPGEAENIADVRKLLAMITVAAYAALDIKVPVLDPNSK